MPMSDFLLSLKDVSLAFGGPSVLDSVSLSVSKGLRAALTGRNGEGKSTLLKVIAGKLEPDSGEIVRAPEQLLAYSGTLLLVSHDREFLNNVETSTFALEGDGTVKQFPGGYDDYERQRAAKPKVNAPPAPPVKSKLDIRVRVKPLAAAKKKEFTCNPFADL